LAQEKVEEYEDNFCNPYVAARRGYVDAVINPEFTRPYIAQALHMLSTKKEQMPVRKHGNIPL
ncbi:MAG: methylmalonyl-CoA carboxyltransferase, partial [Caldiserica bacterium]|nr:methylmalonyl-CoA carboxyltransferase [Caldisericota bacterium]